MKPTKEVKKAVDVWINKDGIQYEDDGQDMQVAHTRKEVMDNYFRLRIELEELEDLAQFIWDTATEKERNRKIIPLSGNWKSLDGIIEKRASTQTAKEIISELKLKGQEETYWVGKATKKYFVISDVEYQKLKKKYKVK